MTTSPVDVALQQHLAQHKVFDDIRKLIRQHLIEQKGDQPPTEQLERETIADVLGKLSRSPVQSGKLVVGKRYLHVRVQGGKAFMDECDDSSSPSPAILTIFAEFRGHRFRGRSVPAQVEPKFADSFFLPLQDLEDEQSGMITLEAAAQIRDKLALLVLREDTDGRVSVVSIEHVEWRKVLVHGRLALPLELKARDDTKLPVGLLDLEMEILPLKLPPNPRELPVFIEQSTIVQQLQTEDKRAEKINKTFHEYSKHWWKDYQAKRPQHKTRQIKMFAVAEDGNRRFVCRFVQPIRAHRCLDSPLHAARFVRLIPFEKDLKLGGERAEVWHTPHTLLSKRFGDVEDHAVLLCSLLLGFGLDAYVCIGTVRLSTRRHAQIGLLSQNEQGAHAWVLTRTDDSSEVVMWESLTGQRFNVNPTASGLRAGVNAAPGGSSLPFRRVFALFNHRRFFANNQVDDWVLGCRWNLDEPEQWRRMDERAIAALPSSPAITLYPSTINAIEEEETIERRLKAIIAQHRRDKLGTHAVFDEDFAYVLSPALSAYETERVTGICPGNEEFQSAIKTHIPVGFAFKAVPFQFAHTDAPRMLQTMLRNSSLADVLSTRGSRARTRFAVRARIVAYPENFLAVWLMLAVKYKEHDIDEGIDLGAAPNNSSSGLGLSDSSFSSSRGADSARSDVSARPPLESKRAPPAAAAAASSNSQLQANSAAAFSNPTAAPPAAAAAASSASETRTVGSGVPVLSSSQRSVHFADERKSTSS